MPIVLGYLSFTLKLVYLLITDKFLSPTVQYSVNKCQLGPQIVLSGPIKVQPIMGFGSFAATNIPNNHSQLTATNISQWTVLVLDYQAFLVGAHWVASVHPLKQLILSHSDLYWLIFDTMNMVESHVVREYFEIPRKHILSVPYKALLPFGTAGSRRIYKVTQIENNFNSWLVVSV